MAWFEVTSNVFRNISSSIMSSYQNPERVIEVKQDKYSDCAVSCREEDLILYQNQLSSDLKYEIVLLRPHSDQAYSLYRSKELEDAQLQFLVLKDKLPLLVRITPWTCNPNGIQKLCDILREKQSWSVGHIVVHFKWSSSITDPSIQSFMDVPDAVTGMTPIQLAIQNRDISIVRQLIAANVSLDHLDIQQNSVFHYAASTNKEIAMALIEAKSEDDVRKHLNGRNADGYTPLHISCQADNPDCVKTFLQCGADCNMTAFKCNYTSQPSATPGYVADFMKDNPNKLHIQDMKFGGTPLHWSCSREVIESLVDRNCDVDAVNFDGRTALHMMVIRNRLACVVALLSRHAEINITDEEGNTALHFAIGVKNIAIVQALIVFGADINHLNNSGFSPRHLAALENDPIGEKILYVLHAVGAARCDSCVHGCTDGCSRTGSYNGVPPAVPEGAQVRAIMRCFENYGDIQKLKETKGGRLLCLDGGGIRGLILVSVLLSLEVAVNRPIIHCFDWLAGTSTGAILALGLAAGKTLKECQCLYFRMKEYAFAGTRPYSSEPLEKMLKKALGSDTVMTDIKHPKVMITAVLADRKPVDMHLFRNYENPSEIIDPNPSYGAFTAPTPPNEQFLWHAARASGAAPSYFKSCDRFIDGGLIANNPTLDALTEIHEYNLALKTVGRGSEAKPVSVVVSVGTGCVPVVPVSKKVEIFRPESPMDGLRFMTGVSALANLLVDQATQADGRVIDRCRSWCSMINVPFFRFSPQLSEDIAMDEKSDEKLVNMLWETVAYMTTNKKEVQKLAVILNYELDANNPMECKNQ